MSSSGIFEELVITEAMIRGRSVIKDQKFYDADGKLHDARNPDKGDNQEAVGYSLFQQFISLYNFQFQDSSQHHKVVEEKHCNTRDLKPDEKKAIKALFKEFAQAHYDSSGQLAVTQEQAAAALYHLYNNIRNIPLHHAEVTLGLLFTQMGRGDKWKDIAPAGIDFTRGDAPPGDIQHFRDAFDKSKQHYPESSSFIQHPESFIEIEGMRFMAKNVNGWQKVFITPSGYLLDLKGEERKNLARLIREHKPIDNYKATPLPYNIRKESRLTDYQNPSLGASEKGIARREEVRRNIAARGFTHKIDGEQAVYPNEATDRDGNKTRLVRAPETPVCMDVDLMTGLWMKPFKGDKDSELGMLKKFMAKHGVNGFADLLNKDHDINIRALPDEVSKEKARKSMVKDIEAKIGELKRKAAEEKNGDMDGLLSRAAEKLKIMMPIVHEAADKAFFMKDEKGNLTNELKVSFPLAGKRVYIAQGGTSSGKSGLKKIAIDECGDSLVESSLDDARLHADRYWLYPGTDNHNDDYKSIHEFATAVRDMIMSRAGKKGYNLFVDGSGIPYQNRNDKIAAEFKKKGYEVSVLAAQAPINSALMRFGKRLEEELRIVPIDIFVDKHIGFAAASRNAARDPNVDRFMVQDVTGKREDSYTLSYIIPKISKEEMESIISLSGNKLKEALIAENLVPEWVKLPENGEHEYDLKVIRKNEDKTYRIEVITDMHQYVNMVQKGLLNRNAEGPEALFNYTLAHDIAGHFRGNDGHLRIQEPRGVVVEQMNGFAPLAGAQGPIDRVSPVNLTPSGQQRGSGPDHWFG